MRLFTCATAIWKAQSNSIPQKHRLLNVLAVISEDASPRLEALRGSLVLLSRANVESFWQFKHPDIGDAYASILVQSLEHLGIFIQGSAPERLIDQVTCGDVGIEKAVVVPKSLFPQL